jgi:hypothetical protein
MEKKNASPGRGIRENVGGDRTETGAVAVVEVG